MSDNSKRCITQTCQPVNKIQCVASKQRNKRIRDVNLREIKKQFRSVPCVKKNINAFHMSVVHKRMFLDLAVYPYVWLESIFIFRHHDS